MTATSQIIRHDRITDLRPVTGALSVSVALAVAMLFSCADANLPAVGSSVGAICGNSVIEAGEECDDGSFNDNDGACSPFCQKMRCGDLRVGPGEDCDDGNFDDHDGCTTRCSASLLCGNGIIDPGEECDDSNLQSQDTCLNNCRLARCGDGIVRSDIHDDAASGFEGCDNGDRNSNTEPGACRISCAIAQCGDGIIDVGEDCDPGPGSQINSSCRPGCVAPGCGDGIVDPGEECDHGAQNGAGPGQCRIDCSAPICGDAIIDPGEECDDPRPGSPCTAACTRSRCGDGVVHQSAGEVCDDAGETATCDTDCTAPKCGDDLHNQAAGEECDQAEVPMGQCRWCALSCFAGYSNCNQNLVDGCETDILNSARSCGACAHDCVDGTCEGGECQPVILADLPEPDEVGRLLAPKKGSHDEVVFSHAKDGLVRVDLDAAGHHRTRVFPDITPLYGTFAVLGDDVYFTRLSPTGIGIFKRNTRNNDEFAAGPQAVRLGALPLALQSDSKRIFYPLQSADSLDIVAFEPQRDEATIIGSLDTSEAAVSDLLVEENDLYLALSSPGELWHFKIRDHNEDDDNSTRPRLVATTSGHPTRLAHNEGYLYWGDSQGRLIARVPVAADACGFEGRCAPETVADNTGPTESIAVVDGHVYWAHGNSVSFIDLSAETPERNQLGQDQGVVDSVATDGRFVYWTSGQDNNSTMFRARARLQTAAEPLD